MRTIPVVLLLALGCLATPARAGLYNSADPVPPIPPGRLPDTIKDLSSLAAPLKEGAVPTPGTVRFHYQSQLQFLEALRRERPLTVTECADLGACYIRFGKVREALETLRNQGDNKHFLLQANLAVAYHAQGNWHQAVRAQQAALELWPNVHAGWSLQQLAWYRHVDRYYLRLLQARFREQELRESGRSPKGTNSPDQLDQLFPEVKFVGSDGKTYEAGALARAMVDQLPHDALQVVVQLVVWLPGDNRLCWLLAELLNAGGFVEPAAEILQDLSWARRFGPPDLLAHRGVLRQAVPVLRELRDSTKRGQLLAGLTVPPLFAPPGLGAAAQGSGALVPVDLLPRLELGPGPAPAPPPAPDSPGGAPNVAFDWRHITVGFLAGGLVTFLLGLQWQEWMRRRNAANQWAPARIPETSLGVPPSGQPPGEETAVTPTQPSSRDPAQT
jgi:tetratricopeptide (TPR) repeat protein